MIGKIYTIMTSYYNKATKKMAFKGRPALIIGKADGSDYIVLPISSVRYKDNLDPYYDIEIDLSKYKLLELSKTISYVRTHKQTPVHYGEISTEISDLKGLYPELFNLIIDRVCEFQNEMLKDAKK